MHLKNILEWIRVLQEDMYNVIPFCKASKRVICWLWGVRPAMCDKVSMRMTSNLRRGVFCEEWRRQLVCEVRLYLYQVLFGSEREKGTWIKYCKVLTSTKIDSWLHGQLIWCSFQFRECFIIRKSEPWWSSSVTLNLDIGDKLTF